MEVTEDGSEGGDDTEGGSGSDGGDSNGGSYCCTNTVEVEEVTVMEVTRVVVMVMTVAIPVVVMMVELLPGHLSYCYYR